MKYLIQKGVNIRGVIDNDPEKAGASYEGVPVMPFSHVKQDNRNIFIAVGADDKVAEIERQILDKYPNTRILKLIDLLQLLDKKFGCEVWYV